MTRKLLVILALAATAASAREPDGSLGLIRTPNNGIPALVTPGDVFGAVLTGRAALRLAGRGSALELAAEWTPLPNGRFKAQCTVPTGTQPGTYALEAVAGDKVDRNVRSVYVRESFPKNYAIAHLTDTHIGSNRHFRSSEDIFRDLVKAVNASRAAFVLVTGDLTDHGTPDELRSFINVLNRCTLPTFVCAGEHDHRGQHYERFFGPGRYLFWFGHDGYLSFDTGDYVVASELGPQDGDLQILRRAIKPARWSIGFTHRYDSDQGMRSQITLFIDNPLDHLLYGHWHRANREEEGKVPWGRTFITFTPAGIDGAMRLIDVSPSAIRPMNPEYVADVD